MHIVAEDTEEETQYFAVTVGKRLHSYRFVSVFRVMKTLFSPQKEEERSPSCRRLRFTPV